MYSSKEEILKAYSKWGISHMTGDLYSISGRLFRLNESNEGFEFEALE